MGVETDRQMDRQTERIATVIQREGFGSSNAPIQDKKNCLQ